MIATIIGVKVTLIYAFRQKVAYIEKILQVDTSASKRQKLERVKRCH
jgi:hypothetical protein